MLGVGTSSRPGWGQTFPDRPIAVITGFAPGGLTDLSTRVIVRRMGQELGQPIVVENRSGGATSIASQAVGNARADGYTVLMGASSLAINQTLHPNLFPQNPLEAFMPIGLGYRSAFVLQIHPSLPARNLADFIAYAKAHPGKINFGSSGTGAVNHLCMEMLCRQSGLEVVHVPYRGGAQAVIDITTGRIQAMFSAVLEAQPLVSEEKTRALAISSRNRSPVLPDVPPVADTLPGFEGLFWQGLFAPRGTPEAVVARLGAALRVATEDAEVRSTLAERGVSVDTGDAQMLRDILLSDAQLWGKVIRDGNIRPD